MRPSAVQKNVHELFQQLGYDFTQFTLPHFIHWLEEREKVTFQLLAWDAEPGCSGSLWLDYEPNHHLIFYNQNVSPLHQAHIILHELAHYLLGHTPEHQVTRQELTRWFHRQELSAKSIFLRSQLSDEQEQEAELLAMLIQSHIIQAERFSALHQPIPLLTDLGLG